MRPIGLDVGVACGDTMGGAVAEKKSSIFEMLDHCRSVSRIP